MNIIHVDPENIRPAEWKTNHILTPDLRLLRKSLVDYGWIYPILVRKEGMQIIDGFARWLLAVNDKALTVKGKIPVVVIDCDEANAIFMHIRLNRARGSVVAKHLSAAVIKLQELGYTNENQVKEMLEMSTDEYDILSEPKLVKIKKLANHEYSRAWVPVEVSDGSVTPATEMKFERPPNEDS